MVLLRGILFYLAIMAPIWGQLKSIIVNDLQTEKIGYHMQLAVLAPNQEIENLALVKLNWQLENKAHLYFGWAENVLLHFALENQEAQPKRMFLDLGNARQDYIQIWQRDGLSLKSLYVLGDTLPFEQRPIKRSSFIVPLVVPRGISNYYIKLSARYSFNRIYPRIFNEEAYLNQQSLENSLFGAVYGVLLLGFLTALFLTLTGKNKESLTFVLFFFINGLVILALNGTTLKVFVPNLPLLANYDIYFLVPLMAFSHTAFFYTKLRNSLNKTTLTTLRILLAAYLVLTLVNPLIAQYSYQVALRLASATILLSSTLILVITLSIFFVKKDDKLKLFTLGVVFYNLAIYMNQLTLREIIPGNLFTEQSYNLWLTLSFLVHTIDAIQIRFGVHKESKRAKQIETIPKKQILAKLNTLMKSEKLYQQSELALNDVAKELKMHPHNLSAFLNVHLSSSFSSFINQFRLDDAEKLLSNTNLPVNRIAYQVGFNSNAYFHYVFKKVKGITPSAFRKLEMSNKTG